MENYLLNSNKIFGISLFNFKRCIKLVLSIIYQNLCENHESTYNALWHRHGAHI